MPAARRVRALRLAAPLAAALAACGGGVAGPPPECVAPATAPARDEAWRADLACVVATVKTRHPGPFERVPEAVFDAAARDLEAAIPALGDDAIAARLMTLAALLRDAHTVVRAPATPLAIEMARFPEGLYVVGAGEGLGPLLGRRVLALGGVDVAEARARVAALIPQENESTTAAREAGLLGTLEVLRGVGVADDSGAVDVETELPGGGSERARVPPLASALTAFPASPPRSLRQRDLAFWYEVDDAARTVYVQYNRCEDRVDFPMSRLASEVGDALALGLADRVVLDMRWNGGGNSLVVAPLAQTLRAWSGSADPQRLALLVGVETFSSAILNALELRETTAARTIGEMPGGNPNGFGEVRQQPLPHGGLVLQHSTRRFQLTNDPANRFLPDEEVTWPWTDYGAGRDPVLAAAGLP